MAGKQSTFGMAVYLSGTHQQPRVAYRTGRSLTQREAAPPRVPLAQAMNTESLWNALWPNGQGDPNQQRNVLARQGERLAQWLFDATAIAFLQQLSTQQGQAPWRIELVMEDAWLVYPWETMRLAGIDLAVDNGFTLVLLFSGREMEPPLESPVPLLLQGGSPQAVVGGAEMDVGHGLETIRTLLSQEEGGKYFYLVSDYAGHAQALVDRYKQHAPPPFFHYFGHGLNDGAGLVFLNGQGRPENMEAERIAQLLKGKVRLAFFSACQTANDSPRTLHPFGSLAQLLIKQNVPVVAGFKTLVAVDEATHMAVAFYRALSRGDGVDVAMQQARRASFIERRRVEWAFLTLHLAATPAPMITPTPPSPPSADLLKFGFSSQNNIINHYLGSREPLVVVIPGGENMGHLHFMKQVKHHLEREGRITCPPPMGQFFLTSGADDETGYAQLLGHLATSLRLEDTGSLTELETLAAKKIADLCSNERVLVFSVQNVVPIASTHYGRTLLILLKKLWSRLMVKATACNNGRPVAVFLLLPVVDPTGPGSGRIMRDHHLLGRLREWIAYHQNRRAIQKMIVHLKGTLHMLQQEMKNDQERYGNTRMELLPELAPFQKKEVSDFLDRALKMPSGPTEALVSQVMGINNDNDTIIENIGQLIQQRGAP